MAFAACVLIIASPRVARPADVDAASGAVAEAGLGRLMQEFAARPHRHAAFAERDQLAVLKRPLESSGELFYDAPDRLEKRTLSPKPETLLLDHGSISIERGKRTYSLTLRDAPAIAPFIDGVRATLAGDLPALEATYIATFIAVGGDWTLALVPRERRLAALFEVIRIRGRAADMQSVEVRRANGDRSLMTIQDLDR